MRKKNKLPHKKVAVAVSGGVDSGVAAAILVKQGYQVTGFNMKLWYDEPINQLRVNGLRIENKCCDKESSEAARRTCQQLGISYYEVCFSEVFKKKVVDYFLKEYAAGLTPNPCVQCNKFIKFGELLDYVSKFGFDFLATGHYARKFVIRNPQLNNYPITSYGLRIAKDKTKDQSYFLYNLKQEQLSRILFPVGDYTKKEVRTMARKWQLPVAERPESQEICFFAESDYRPFLKRQIPQKIVFGEVIDTQGQVIGRHQGILLYTIGQRHGFALNSKLKSQNSKLIPPFYVIGKDTGKNRLIVGFGKETEKKEFWVKDINWINQLRVAPACRQGRNYGLKVRIRHQGELLASSVKGLASRAKVTLDEPERGIAPGQSAVFYQKEEVLGGGIIV